MELSEEILASWFSQVDQQTGWICREQMLGREIRAGAPPTSWPQSASAANPPSQHLVIDRIITRFDEDAELKEREYKNF